MMYEPIMKFIFIVGIQISWAMLSKIVEFTNSTFLEFPNTNLHQCKDIISLNAEIIDIGPDFILRPSITCLNFTNKDIKNIASFRNLPNLTDLFLSNNNIDSSNGTYYFGAHEKLNVLVLNNVMSNRNGQIIGKFGNYPNLEILIARNNNFTDLQSEQIASSDVPLEQTIRFPKLKFLDLSENSIGYFPDMDKYLDISFEFYIRPHKHNRMEFMNLLSDTLQFLDLHDNKLNSLSLNKKGSNLLALNVDNNYLQYVVYTAYRKIHGSLELALLQNLRYLSMSGNKIEHFRPNAFADSKKLIYLNLSKNNLYNCMCFTFNLFAHLNFLQVLDLSSNQFDCVPDISNENVNVLDLSCNKIESVTPNVFLSSPKLTKLLLGGNQINKIYAEAFAHLSALEKLDLSNNKLNSLPEEWTESLTSLKYLDLSDNMFISLESLSLKSTLPLIELYLVINPLMHTNITHTENLPQSLTVNLMQKSNFACKCIA